MEVEVAKVSEVIGADDVRVGLTIVAVVEVTDCSKVIEVWVTIVRRVSVKAIPGVDTAGEVFVALVKVTVAVVKVFVTVAVESVCVVAVVLGIVCVLVAEIELDVSVILVDVGVRVVDIQVLEVDVVIVFVSVVDTRVAEVLVRVKLVQGSAPDVFVGGALDGIQLNSRSNASNALFAMSCGMSVKR
jgi:hypothetical protein